MLVLVAPRSGALVEQSTRQRSHLTIEYACDKILIGNKAMKCLEYYLKIFERYPLNDKRFKKERNIALHTWRVDKNDYTLLKIEVCRFIDANRNIINSVFIRQAVCPLVYDCINNNDYDFVNELIKTIGIDESQKISLKDIFDIYCEYTQWEKSPI